MCKTISPFFYYSELKRYERKKVLSDTNNFLLLVITYLCYICSNTFFISSLFTPSMISLITPVFLYSKEIKNQKSMKPPHHAEA